MVQPQPSSVVASGHILAGRPLIPVWIRHPDDLMGAFSAAALLDTGCVNSAVSQRLAALLGLPVVGQQQVSSPLSTVVVPTYLATIEILASAEDGGAPAAALHNRPLGQLAAPMVGTDLVIGMDIIELGQLTMENHGWRFKL